MDLDDRESDDDSTSKPCQKRPRFPRSSPVDGGWAWVVLCAVVLGNIVQGIIIVIGLFNAIFLEVFGRSKETTAWVVATTVSVRMLLAPLTSIMHNAIGARWTLTIGTLLSTAGYLWAAMAANFFQLFIAFGILVGVGTSGYYIPLNMALGLYFKKYRNLAYGITGIGSGLSAIFYPLVIDSFLEYYGWRGTLIIVAGINLHMCVVAALLRPVVMMIEDDYLYTEIVTDDNRNPNKELCDSPLPNSARSRSNTFIDSLQNVAMLSYDDVASEQLQTSVKRTNIKRNAEPASCWGKIINAYRKTALAKLTGNRSFMLNNLFGGVAQSANYIVNVHFVAYAMTTGTSVRNASLLLLSQGLAVSIGRFIVGAATDRSASNIITWNIAGSSLLCCLSILCPFITRTVIGQGVYICINGLLASIFNTLFSPMVFAICDMDSAALGLGISCLTCGFGCLIGPPFAGWLYDISGSYDLSFYSSGALWFLALLLIIPILVTHKLHLRKLATQVEKT